MKSELACFNCENGHMQQTIYGSHCDTCGVFSPNAEYSLTLASLACDWAKSRTTHQAQQASQAAYRLAVSEADFRRWCDLCVRIEAGQATTTHQAEDLWWKLAFEPEA